MFHYTREVAAGHTPSIQGAVTATAAAINSAALADCLARYKAVMGGVALPSEDEAALTSQHEKCLAEVVGVFGEKIMVVDSEADLGKQLAVRRLYI